NAGPFGAGGVFVSSGTGTITGGTEDFNDGGIITANSTVGGSYSMATNGRGTLSLTTSSGTSTFAIYPSSGGVLAVQTDIRFVTTGTALQQTPPFNAGTLFGTYGLNFTGVTTNGELDSIAQFTADGAGQLHGMIDVNNAGGITFGQPLSGNFTIASNGRSTVTLQTPIGTQNMVFYVVNGNRALFVELDSALIAAGELRHQ